MKINKYAAVFICLLALSASSYIAAAAITITGNTLNYTPQVKPTIVLSSNSTSTPYVGDTIQLTATITPATADKSVNFWVNGVSIAAVNTNAVGQAVYNYHIIDTTALAIYPTATV